MDGGLLAGAVAGVGAALLAFLGLTVVGVAVLRRRARSLPRGAAPESRALEAGPALVAADDAVRDAADELAFAEAQFGADAVRDFATAVSTSREELGRAFALQARLQDARGLADDAGPRRRRDRETELLALARSARERVVEQGVRFSELRRAEAASPDAVARLRSDDAALTSAAAEAGALLASLREDYADAALRGLDTELERAAAALTSSRADLDAAEAQLDATAVSAVTTRLDHAAGEQRRARAAIDAVARRRDELAAADKELARLRDTDRASIADARRVRDAPPDPDSAAEVNGAIAALEPLLRERRGRRDPLAELDALVAASDRLDVAVAAAHNEQRRLDGARAALGGALIAARSQIERASDAVSAGRASVGSGARGRLAEAERELRLAEAEADPVAALDGARRAATHARDAEALARYAG